MLSVVPTEEKRLSMLAELTPRGELRDQPHGVVRVSVSSRDGQWVIYGDDVLGYRQTMQVFADSKRDMPEHVDSFISYLREHDRILAEYHGIDITGRQYKAGRF